jgi:hypothetical protein
VKTLAVLFLTFLALNGWSAAGAGQENKDSKVDPKLWKQVQERGTARVIVDLNVPGWESKKSSKEDELARRQKVADAQRLVLRELGGTHYKVNRQFEIVPGLALEVGADALAALERSSHVLKITEDAKLSPSMERIEVIGTPEKKESSK